MNISDKRYPYPVLRPDGDDYEGSAFDVALEVVQTPEKVTLTLTPTLRDNGLRQLIGVARAAKIICHVECPKTVYRTSVDVAMPVCETASEAERTVFEIAAADLSGLVSVCPFIVATSDIPDYSNEAFNPDYEGEAFSIESGAVLAEGRQKTCFVDTAKEALELSPSIFTITRGGDQLKVPALDWSGQKLVIKLPENAYEQYNILKDNPEDRETLWAMFIVPALVEILASLAEMRRNNPDDLAEYRDLKWFWSIDRLMKSRLGHGIDSPEFEQDGIYSCAMNLIKNCACEALHKMAVGQWNGREEA